MHRTLVGVVIIFCALFALVPRTLSEDATELTYFVLTQNEKTRADSIYSVNAQTSSAILELQLPPIEFLTANSAFSAHERSLLAEAIVLTGFLEPTSADAFGISTGIHAMSVLSDNLLFAVITHELCDEPLFVCFGHFTFETIDLLTGKRTVLHRLDYHDQRYFNFTVCSLYDELYVRRISPNPVEPMIAINIGNYAECASSLSHTLILNYAPSVAHSILLNGQFSGWSPDGSRLLYVERVNCHHSCMVRLKIVQNDGREIVVREQKMLSSFPVAAAWAGNQSFIYQWTAFPNGFADTQHIIRHQLGVGVTHDFPGRMILRDNELYFIDSATPYMLGLPAACCDRPLVSFRAEDITIKPLGESPVYSINLNSRFNDYTLVEFPTVSLPLSVGFINNDRVLQTITLPQIPSELIYAVVPGILR